MELTFPKHVGVSSVNLKRVRAETNSVTISYWFQDRYYKDATFWDADHEDDRAVNYKPKNPQHFRVSRKNPQLRFKVEGEADVKREVIWYPDRAVVNFYTGYSEGVNTVLTMFFDQKVGVPEGGTPTLDAKVEGALQE